MESTKDLSEDDEKALTAAIEDFKKSSYDAHHVR